MDVVVPVGEGDRQVVRSEVFRYWRARMLRSGSGLGAPEGCSESFPAGDRDSDYAEHQVLMEASAADLRALYAMWLARGVAPASQDWRS